MFRKDKGKELPLSGQASLQILILILACNHYSILSSAKRLNKYGIFWKQFWTERAFQKHYER